MRKFSVSSVDVNSQFCEGIVDADTISVGLDPWGSGKAVAWCDDCYPGGEEVEEIIETDHCPVCSFEKPTDEVCPWTKRHPEILCALAK